MSKRFVCAGVIIGALIFGSMAAFAGDQPTIDVKWYGYVKLDGSYDQNLTSHGNFVMWVSPRAYGKDDEQFNMTANQSRLGVTLTGNGYSNVKVGGNIEFDLYGGVSGATVAQNKALLMLRHAYFTIQSGNTKLLAGQSWDLISPLNPSTLNYGVLWGCGNFGYRRAQISLWQTVPAGEQTTVTLAGGAFRTIGSDLTPSISLAAGETAEGTDDGTDAGIPSFQGYFDVKHKFSKGGAVRTGVSGLWGQLKAETTLGNSETYKSWAAVWHFQADLANGWGWAGEVFTGSNLVDYLGGILNNSSVDGVSTTGAWASGWIKASPKVKFTAGYGLDNPKDEDLGAKARAQNSCIFGNVTYALIPMATVGFEVSNWQTKYKDSETAKNLRGQTSFILTF